MSSQEQTIARLHRKYGGVIYAKCARILANRTEAEDATQETFLNAYKGLSTFHYGESHLPWLSRIASNTCMRILKKRSRRRENYGQREVRGTNPDPRQIVESRITLTTLYGELDERNRQILVWHFIEGIEQGQVAERLGISRRAVVKRLTALRGTLQEVCDA
ncbi:MAG: sigma-70 family RNA polymerase sigma factor [Deltaproteobacteria bacterium]|nr:sigma-70 family RNA polymerase sigma factor [Deltaproteobacteria bacterium]